MERTQAGLAAARARGRKGGRPKGSVRYDPKKLALAQQLYAEQKHSVADICKMQAIPRTTFYRYLSRHQDNLAESKHSSAG